MIFFEFFNTHINHLAKISLINMTLKWPYINMFETLDNFSVVQHNMVFCLFDFDHTHECILKMKYIKFWLFTLDSSIPTTSRQWTNIINKEGEYWSINNQVSQWKKDRLAWTSTNCFVCLLNNLQQNDNMPYPFSTNVWTTSTYACWILIAHYIIRYQKNYWTCYSAYL
jgi:hypothetical protein